MSKMLRYFNYLDKLNIPCVLSGTGSIKGCHVASLRNWQTSGSASLPGWAVLGVHALLVEPLVLQVLAGLLGCRVTELHSDFSLALIAFGAFSVLNHALAGHLQLLVEVDAQELLGEVGVLALVGNADGVGADVEGWERSAVDHQLEPVLDVSGSEVVGQGDPVGPGGGVSDGLDDGPDHPLAAAEEHPFAVGVGLSSEGDFDFL